MTIAEFAAVIVAIAVVVASAFLITAVNNLNNSLARLEDTAQQLRTEGLAAFRQVVELDANLSVTHFATLQLDAAAAGRI